MKENTAEELCAEMISLVRDKARLERLRKEAKLLGEVGNNWSNLAEVVIGFDI